MKKQEKEVSPGGESNLTAASPTKYEFMTPAKPKKL